MMYKVYFKADNGQVYYDGCHAIEDESTVQSGTQPVPIFDEYPDETDSIERSCFFLVRQQ
jgi:hypothetical protein